jgi:hypothetical protein
MEILSIVTAVCYLAIRRAFVFVITLFGFYVLLQVFYYI